MVLIDGLPIVSGLSTVYGFSGIPQFLIERVEIVKGPVSNLYGSEAIGGVINLITKLPENTSTLNVNLLFQDGEKLTLILELSTDFQITARDFLELIILIIPTL